MNLRFYLDPATGQPHIWNHDVTEEEVEEVLENAERTDLEETAPEWPSARRGVVAIYLRGKPLLAYRRRQRRKHR